MQVDPIKPKLKPPRSERLKLHCDHPLSRFACKFNLRRYTKEAEEANAIASECQAGLDKALPALEEASAALNVLTKKAGTNEHALYILVC